MGIGINCAAVGAREQQKRLEIISNNIANSSTAGFKKEIVRFEHFLSQATATNLEQGPIRGTANPLDIALSGKGFLKVQTDQGVLYTRQGVRLYRDVLERRLDPRGKPYYWIGGEAPTGLMDEGTDYWAIKQGYISVTPLQMDMTNKALLGSLNHPAG